MVSNHHLDIQRSFTLTSKFVITWTTSVLDVCFQKSTSLQDHDFKREWD